MDISHKIYYLKEYATQSQWQNTTMELCQSVIRKIFSTPPTEKTWLALMELFAVWPNAVEIQRWVMELEPQIDLWSWPMRQSILGQQQTRGDKQCVYRLVGYLHINNVEDTSGQKLKRWSQNKNWENLKGISLYKVETEAEQLAAFLNSQFLQKLHTLELKALDTLSSKIKVVFNRSQLDNLKELKLISLCLKYTDIMELSSLPISKQITILDISSNFIYSKDVPNILNPALFPNLETLNISYTTINPQELKNAISSLNHPTIKQIVFEGTQAAKGLGVSSLSL